MAYLNPSHAIVAFGLQGHILPQSYCYCYHYYSSAPTKDHWRVTTRFSLPLCIIEVQIILFGLIDRPSRSLGLLLAPPDFLHRG